MTQDTTHRHANGHKNLMVKRPRGRPKRTGRVNIFAPSNDNGNESLTENDIVYSHKLCVFCY